MTIISRQVLKSALLNMFANDSNAFKVDYTLESVTVKAEYKEYKWIGDQNGITVRLCDTQGLSDSSGRVLVRKNIL